MQKKPKGGVLPAGAADPAQQPLEIELYHARLWTVSKEGELTMPLTSPPAGQCEAYGPFWEVRPCGDHGGPPAGKVRDMC